MKDYKIISNLWIENKIKDLEKTKTKFKEHNIEDWIEIPDYKISILKELQKELKPIRNIIPYQSCPKCNGQGLVDKPPYVSGDATQWSGSQTSYQCNVCDGKKIIPMKENDIEDNSVEFADFILQDYEMDEFQENGGQLCWKMVGTSQKYLSADLYEGFLKYKSGVRQH